MKYAKVKVIRDEDGVAVDYVVEGDYPKYGNNNEDVDALLIDKERRVLGNQQSSFTAARDVLDFYFKKLSEK